MFRLSVVQKGSLGNITSTILCAALGALLFLAGTAHAQQPCVPAPSGLVSWWDADSVTGTTVMDIVGANDGTLENGATTVPGFVGQAFSFDGVDDSIKFTGPTLNLAGAFSFDFWIKKNSASLGDVFIITERGDSK